jgi:hypothetical protein
VGFGDADADRVIVLSLQRRHASAEASVTVTIGGVTATQHTSQKSSSTTTAHLYSDVYSAAVPTGTSGTVELTGASATVWMAFGVYRLVGFSQTPTDTYSENDTVNFSDTLTTVDGDFVVGSVASNLEGPSTAWTGLAEDYDNDVGADGPSGASAVASGTTQALTADISGGNTAFCSASAAALPVS